MLEEQKNKGLNYISNMQIVLTFTSLQKHKKLGRDTYLCNQ